MVLEISMLLSDVIGSFANTVRLWDRGTVGLWNRGTVLLWDCET